MSIRILLVDDHKALLDSIRSIINHQPERDMEVVGEAGDGDAALLLAKLEAPDIIVMDVIMPDMGGITATRKITAQLPHVKVLALSMHANRRFAEEMLKAGALGYILKDNAFEELIPAIRAVLRNEVYISSELADVNTGEEEV